MAIDFARLFYERGIPFDDTVNRGWINVRCPVCGDHGHHGGFNIGGSYYHCWKCGGHNLTFILSRLLNLSRQDIESLIEVFDVHSAVTDLLNKRQPAARLVDMIGEELGKPHRRYLKGRGFDPDELVQKYKIRGTGNFGSWKLRIIIPIYLKGKLVAFQGRDITDNRDPRYMNLELEKCALDPKDILYNSDNCPGSTLALVEGVTDVWKLGDGFAATLGTSMTSAQLAFIRKRWRRVLFLFDPEPEAQARAKKSATALAAIGIDTEIVDLEMDHDPGDATPEEVTAIRAFVGL